MPLRSDLQPVLDALVARGDVTLDAVAEALETAAATPTDIEALFDALDEAGIEVGSPDDVNLRDELRRVLAAARTLGRFAPLDEIATSAGLDRAGVRRALLYARVLQR